MGTDYKIESTSQPPCGHHQLTARLATMSDNLSITFMIAAGVSSTIGLSAVSLAIGVWWGRSLEKETIRQTYHLIKRGLFNKDDKVLLLNLDRKACYVHTGDPMPKKTTAVFDDHSVELTTAANYSLD
jgi:hypothetical protein